MADTGRLEAAAATDWPPPDPITEHNLGLIAHALVGVELTDAEAKSLAWLAGWPTSTVEHITAAFGRAGGRSPR